MSTKQPADGRPSHVRSRVQSTNVAEDAVRRKSNACALVAFLLYALEDARAVSPISTYLLEMLTAAITEDLLAPEMRLLGEAKKP